MSQLTTILDTVVQGVTALGLQLNGKVLPVVKRKLPKKQEVVDLGAQITVSGTVDVDRQKPWAFGAGTGTALYRVDYRIEITLICPNDNDAVTNLDAYTQFRESIRQAFRNAPLAGTQVYDQKFDDGPFLDRGNMHDGYDYQQVVIKMSTIET